MGTGIIDILELANRRGDGANFQQPRHPVNTSTNNSAFEPH